MIISFWYLDVWLCSCLFSSWYFTVQWYLDFSCCAAVPGNGLNKELALHLLQLKKGNIMVGQKLLPKILICRYLKLKSNLLYALNLHLKIIKHIYESEDRQTLVILKIGK